MLLIAACVFPRESKDVEAAPIDFGGSALFFVRFPLFVGGGRAKGNRPKMFYRSPLPSDGLQVEFRSVGFGGLAKLR